MPDLERIGGVTGWLRAAPLPATHRIEMSSHLFFFFNDTATTEIYTLSLHDALPTSTPRVIPPKMLKRIDLTCGSPVMISSASTTDRKSTRLNSSHVKISYAVFC